MPAFFSQSDFQMLERGDRVLSWESDQFKGKIYYHWGFPNEIDHIDHLI